MRARSPHPAVDGGRHQRRNDGPLGLGHIAGVSASSHGRRVLQESYDYLHTLLFIFIRLSSAALGISVLLSKCLHRTENLELVMLCPMCPGCPMRNQDTHLYLYNMSSLSDLVPEALGQL